MASPNTENRSIFWRQAAGGRDRNNARTFNQAIYDALPASAKNEDGTYHPDLFARSPLREDGTYDFHALVHKYVSRYMENYPQVFRGMSPEEVSLNVLYSLMGLMSMGEKTKKGPDGRPQQATNYLQKYTPERGSLPAYITRFTKDKLKHFQDLLVKKYEKEGRPQTLMSRDEDGPSEGGQGAYEPSYMGSEWNPGEHAKAEHTPKALDAEERERFRNLHHKQFTTDHPGVYRDKEGYWNLDPAWAVSEGDPHPYGVRAKDFRKVDLPGDERREYDDLHRRFDKNVEHRDPIALDKEMERYRAEHPVGVPLTEEEREEERRHKRELSSWREENPDPIEDLAEQSRLENHRGELFQDLKKQGKLPGDHPQLPVKNFKPEHIKAEDLDAVNRRREELARKVTEEDPHTTVHQLRELNEKLEQVAQGEPLEDPDESEALLHYLRSVEEGKPDVGPAEEFQPGLGKQLIELAKRKGAGQTLDSPSDEELKTHQEVVDYLKAHDKDFAHYLGSQKHEDTQRMRDYYNYVQSPPEFTPHLVSSLLERTLRGQKDPHGQPVKITPEQVRRVVNDVTKMYVGRDTAFENAHDPKVHEALGMKADEFGPWDPSYKTPQERGLDRHKNPKPYTRRVAPTVNLDRLRAVMGQKTGLPPDAVGHILRVMKPEIEKARFEAKQDRRRKMYEDTEAQQRALRYTPGHGLNESDVQKHQWERWDEKEKKEGRHGWTDRERMKFLLGIKDSELTKIQERARHQLMAWAKQNGRQDLVDRLGVLRRRSLANRAMVTKERRQKADRDHAEKMQLWHDRLPDWMKPYESLATDSRPSYEELRERAAKLRYPWPDGVDNQESLDHLFDMAQPELPYKVNRGKLTPQEEKEADAHVPKTPVTGLSGKDYVTSQMSPEAFHGRLTPIHQDWHYADRGGKKDSELIWNPPSGTQVTTFGKAGKDDDRGTIRARLTNGEKVPHPTKPGEALDSFKLYWKHHLPDAVRLRKGIDEKEMPKKPPAGKLTTKVKIPHEHSITPAAVQLLEDYRNFVVGKGGSPKGGQAITKLTNNLEKVGLSENPRWIRDWLEEHFASGAPIPLHNPNSSPEEVQDSSPEESGSQEPSYAVPSPAEFAEWPRRKRLDFWSRVRHKYGDYGKFEEDYDSPEHLLPMAPEVRHQWRLESSGSRPDSNPNSKKPYNLQPKQMFHRYPEGAKRAPVRPSPLPQPGPDPDPGHDAEKRAHFGEANRRYQQYVRGHHDQVMDAQAEGLARGMSKDRLEEHLKQTTPPVKSFSDWYRDAYPPEERMPAREPHPGTLDSEESRDLSRRPGYDEYAEKMESAGRKPLPHPDWVKGRSNLSAEDSVAPTRSKVSPPSAEMHRSTSPLDQPSLAEKARQKAEFEEQSRRNRENFERNREHGPVQLPKWDHAYVDEIRRHKEELQRRRDQKQGRQSSRGRLFFWA